MQAFSGLGSLGVSSAWSGVISFVSMGGLVAGSSATLAYVAFTRLTGRRLQSKKDWRGGRPTRTENARAGRREEQGIRRGPHVCGALFLCLVMP
jgi:hypothetical protein